MFSTVIYITKMMQYVRLKSYLQSLRGEENILEKHIQNWQFLGVH